MANINMNELTKEQITKAMACKTADELMALAKEEGYELTKEEAEAYMAETSDFELDDDMLDKASGGACYKLGCTSRCFAKEPLPRHQAVP